MDTTSVHMQMLRKYITPGKVFIFSKSYCPWCDKAKELFTNLKVKFEAVEVDQSNGFPNNFIDFINEHANVKTYPKIYIGEECVGGFSEAKKLFDTMKLFEKLKAQGIKYTDA